MNALETRVVSAHRLHGDAVESVQQLATRLDTAFARLEIARERLDQENVTIELRMPDWLTQAFTHWRTGRQHSEREHAAQERIAAAALPLEHVDSPPIA